MILPSPLRLIGILILIGLIVTLGYDHMKNDPKAIASQKVTEQEYSKLTALPGAINVRYVSSHRSTHAGVEAYYTTDESWDEIRTFYLQEAKRNGWTFLSETTITDLGGKSVKSIDFRKDEYHLAIHYAVGNEWTFGVLVSWGLYK